MTHESGRVYKVPQDFDLSASRVQKRMAQRGSESHRLSDLSSETLSVRPGTASSRTVSGHVTCEGSAKPRIPSVAVTSHHPLEAPVTLTTTSLVTGDMTNFEVIDGVSLQSPSALLPGRSRPGFRLGIGSQSVLHPVSLPIFGPQPSRSHLKANEQDDREFTQSTSKASSLSGDGRGCSDSAPMRVPKHAPTKSSNPIRLQGVREKKVAIEDGGPEKEKDVDEKKEVGFFRDRCPPAGYFPSGDATGYPWLTWSSVIHPDQSVLQPTPQQRLAAAQDPSYILHLLLDVGRLLGQGQYGKVYAVALRNSNPKTRLCRLALKKISRGDRETVARAKAEQRALTTGRACPFIVHLISWFQTKFAFYLLMELAEGGPLTDVLNRFGRFPEVNVRFYAAQIFLALSFLHDHNILHRDLKLDNVLMDGTGYIRLCDFGLSTDNFRDDDEVGSPCGTFFYLAPEVFHGVYGKAADWWSYGVLVYLMATGKLPFRGRNIKELLLSITRKEPTYDCFISPALVSFLKKLLNKSERDRPGHKSSGDVSTLSRDPFFTDVDWKGLNTRSVTPPPLPKYRLQSSGCDDSLSPSLHTLLSSSYPAVQHHRQSRRTRSRSLDVAALMPAFK